MTATDHPPRRPPSRTSVKHSPTPTNASTPADPHDTNPPTSDMLPSHIDRPMMRQNLTVQTNHHQPYYHEQPHHAYPDPTHYEPASSPQPTPPRFDSAPPMYHAPQQTQLACYEPTDRSLPDRRPTESTITDAYVQFILYCNPRFPLSVDTTELRSAFEKPTRSEGKTFQIFTLYQLMTRYDNKEIKTWRELVEELGVEKPDVEKGQSTQKVAQYSVRLKKWMKTLHIDAFFEYMYGKIPAYLQDIPAPDVRPNARHCVQFGDMIAAGEDLALRALDPTLKPKRGRRKLEDCDEDEPQSAVEFKRPQLDTSMNYPHSAYPASATPYTGHPGHAQSPDDLFAQANQELLRGGRASWRINNDDSRQSWDVATPMSAHPGLAEPRSAVTPQSSRYKRRHGPAVSSAWSGSAGGRPRGRPPTNRTLTDGHFNTFPVNPQRERASSASMDLSRQGTPVDFPQATPTSEHRASPAPIQRISPVPQSIPIAQMQRPDKLSVTIPINRSAPTLLVNGESQSWPAKKPILYTSHTLNNALPTPTPSTTQSLAFSATSASSFRSGYSLPSASTDQEGAAPYLTPSSGHINNAPRAFSFIQNQVPSLQQATPITPAHLALRPRTPESEPHRFTVPQQKMSSPSPRPATAQLPGLSSDTLKRLLVEDLQRAELSGRRKRLRSAEAKALADAVLLRVRRQDTNPNYNQAPALDTLGDNWPAESRNILLATWLNLNTTQSTPSSIPGIVSKSPKRLTVTRYRITEDGYDTPVEESDDEDTQMSNSHDGRGKLVKEVFDLEWTASFAGMLGLFSLKGLSIEKMGVVGAGAGAGSGSGSGSGSGFVSLAGLGIPAGQVEVSGGARGQNDPQLSAIDEEEDDDGRPALS